MPRKYIGNIVSRNEDKNIIKIENARDLYNGQHVAVYVPTATKMQNSEKNRNFGYKNNLIEVVSIEKKEDGCYVKVTNPAIKIEIPDSTRKIRRFRKGDVIIKIIDK